VSRSWERLSISSEMVLLRAQGGRKKSMKSTPIPLGLSLSKPCSRFSDSPTREGSPTASDEAFRAFAAGTIEATPQQVGKPRSTRTSQCLTARLGFVRDPVEAARCTSHKMQAKANDCGLGVYWRALKLTFVRFPYDRRHSISGYQTVGMFPTDR
jgi:hypothetical protein